MSSRGPRARGDVERLLEEIGRTEPPPPRPSFVAAVEARLRHARATAADPTAKSEPFADLSRLRGRRGPAIALGAVATAVAVVAAVVMFGQSQGDRDSDRLATRPTTSPTTAAASPDDSRPPVTVPSPDAPLSAPAPEFSRRPTTTTPAGPSPAPPTTATTAPAPPRTLTLTAERDLDGVHLSWSRYLGPNFARYLCLRSDAPHRPTYPPDAKTTEVWSEDHQDERYYVDRYAPPGEISYVTVAVDADGRELARSNVVTVRGFGPTTYAGLPDTP